jgi:hypothetical protein
MTEYNLIASREILGLHSNRRSVKWSYGLAIPPGSQAELDACRVVVDLEVLPELPPIAPDADPGKYHYFEGCPGGDMIRYERTLVANRRLQLELGGLLGGRPYLRCNEAYWRYITHRFMNLHSVGYVLTDIASLLLLRNGYAPLHCSGFRKDEAGVAVFAPPNTGKTLTTMQACMKHGGDFVAEDLAITDGTTLHAVPWTSTFRYYGEVDQSRSSRIRSRLTRIFPPVELIPSRNAESIEGYVDEARILDKARITHLVILERGEPGILPISADEAFQKIRNLNRYEFNYAKAPAAVAYEFFNPELDLDGAAEREREILRSMIANADEVLVVRSRNPVDYAEMIWSHLP